MELRDLSVRLHAHTMQPVGSSLNLDVLRTVMTFSSVADLKELAVVSHPLREQASREILTRGVYLRDGTTRFKSFCQFMLTRDPPLYPFLHKLVLERLPNSSVRKLDPNVILEVLSHATYLRDLRIRWYDNLFTADSDKRLQVILPQLQNLRRLEIRTRRDTTDPLVADTVLRLPAQLHTLEFFSDADNQIPRDFPNLLAERQQSLHRLRICYPDLTSIPWTPFTSVRVLSLTIANKLQNLPHLTQIFPNLRDLHIFAVGFEIDLTHPAPEHVQMRQDALAFQRSGRGWKTLDVLLAMSIGDLWVLCLACPVGCVRLGNYDAGNHAAFVDVVARTRPKQVSLHLTCASYCVKPEAEPSLFLLPADPLNNEVGGGGPQGATHVVLPFTIPSFSKGQTTSEIADIIKSHLHGSRIKYLHVAFAEFFLSTPEIDERLLKPRDIHPSSVKVIEAIDVDLLVAEVAAVSTHLRVLVLTLATREQSVWTIEKGESGRRITRVEHAYSAREIIKREERAYLHPI